uniref:TATA-box-binding protein-like n=1 Tax=Dermatophagoides pteronyssinus TaxID=6956 RepID=A0A6P6XP05_DERPT|nr:TATA-box-binding protein-like [Dermatophagoides pteronyssinus]
MLVLVNTIASFSLGCFVNLRELTINARNVEYNPRKLNAATIRFVQPKLSATIFGCGRVSLCGNITTENIKYYSKYITKLVKTCGHENARCEDLKIDCLSFSANCGFPIRLEKLAIDHNRYCHYEPEIYCGLVYRYHISSEFKATILIYVSGRFLITGCKRPSQAYEVYRNLYTVLNIYRG